MSLSSHIVNPESPVLRFMNEALPELAARNNGLRKAFRQTLPSDAEIILLPQEYRSQGSLAGSAVERRLSWALGAAPDDEPERHGIDTVVRHQRRLQRREGASREEADAAAKLMQSIGENIIISAEKTVAQHTVADRRHGMAYESSVEQHLTRAAFGMARLDAAYHSAGNSLVNTTFFGQTLQQTRSTTEAITFGAAQVLNETPLAMLDDVIRQTHLAAESPFAELRRATAASEAHSSVVFKGSDALGGAEADLIVKGQLLDIKSTHRVNSLLTQDLRQLAGYLLLDTENVYDIQEVGIYRTRNGHWFSVDATDFVKMVGSRARLPELRECFDEQVIIPLAQKRQAARLLLEQLLERTKKP